MTIANTEDLVQIVKNKREEKGLSQRKLARMANISNATICCLESGELSNLKLSTVLSIATVLELKLDVSCM